MVPAHALHDDQVAKATTCCHDLYRARVAWIEAIS